MLFRAYAAEVICRYCFGQQYGFFEDLDSAAELFINITRPGDLPYLTNIGRFSIPAYRMISTCQLMANSLKEAMGLKVNSGFTLLFKVSGVDIENVSSADRSI